jgi:hypothetical protein
MSKKYTPTNKPAAETYAHIYKGVEVYVHINYKEGYISLVDRNDHNPNGAYNNGKQWLFKKREIEYMQGWQDILDAMKSAISDATEKLRVFQEQEEKEKIEFMANVQAEIDKK